MFKIPFKWLPASWGLKGKTRKIAEAEYYYSGRELELKLAEIDLEFDNDALELKKLDIEFTHGKLTEYEYEISKNRMQYKDNEQERLLKNLDIELKHNHIDQTQYEKSKANILKEPWISMPKIHWDPIHNGKTYFELDYNEFFIPYLRDNGYEGSDDDIIDKWLNDICISISEEITGMEGNYVTPSRRS